MNLRATNKSALLLGSIHAVLAIAGGAVAEFYTLPDGLAVFGIIVLIAIMMISGWIWVLGMFNISEQIASGTLIKNRLSDLFKTSQRGLFWLLGFGVIMIILNMFAV
ncbi:hypothetical protein [Pseudoalteromonas marina]|uniref:hypothetical protein n=1 Tax=Pseudoalteromonas marina TaxID=267375 RepID=UPI0023EFCA04|nr:hypothetical protein [Pseudoalteromonas marina]